MIQHYFKSKSTLKIKKLIDFNVGFFKLNHNGFTLIELVLSISLFTIIAAGVAVPILGSYLSDLENEKMAQANTHLTETWEALRSIRNRSWANLTNGAYGLSNGGFWEFNGGSDTVNGLTRVITISDARRDPSGDLVTIGGDIDPDTKLINILISWDPTPYKNLQINVDSILTNYANASAWPIP